MDRDLKYIKLQQQVHQETIKLQINEVKESLSAVSMLSNIIGTITKKAVVFKVVNKVLGRKK